MTVTGNGVVEKNVRLQVEKDSSYLTLVVERSPEQCQEYLAAVYSGSLVLRQVRRLKPSRHSPDPSGSCTSQYFHRLN